MALNSVAGRGKIPKHVVVVWVRALWVSCHDIRSELRGKSSRGSRVVTSGILSWDERYCTDNTVPVSECGHKNVSMRLNLPARKYRYQRADRSIVTNISPLSNHQSSPGSHLDIPYHIISAKHCHTKQWPPSPPNPSG